MSTPSIVNLKQSAFGVYIGRGNDWRKLAGSKWSNPFVIGKDGNREQVIEKFRAHLLASPELLEALPELSGKVLGCWCSPLACHGEVLVEVGRQRGLWA